MPLLDAPDVAAPHTLHPSPALPSEQMRQCRGHPASEDKWANAKSKAPMSDGHRIFVSWYDPSGVAQGAPTLMIFFFKEVLRFVFFSSQKGVPITRLVELAISGHEK